MRVTLLLIAFTTLAVPAAGWGADVPEDRYGPPATNGRDLEDAAPTAYLTWPGKPQAAPEAGPPMPAPSRVRLWTSAAAPPAPSALPVSLYAPAASPYAPRVSRPSQPPLMGGVPQAPPPAAQVQAQLQPGAAGTIGEPPRFYSVHRQYGLQPDPITLTPQFVAQTPAADLAEPPPLPPPHAGPAQTANLSPAVLNQARDVAEGDPGGDPGASN